jgi:ABC-type uncharacterized transport system auxiliary subunit
MSKHALLIFLLCLHGSIFTGCSLLRPDSSGIQKYYVLAENDAARARTGRRLNTRLLISPTTAAAFINTQRIVFSKETGTRGYYQLAGWTQSIPRRFTDLLISRLERTEIFESVASTTSGTTARFLLATELTEFYHDAVQQPGSVKVGVRAQLIDRRKRIIVSQKSFHQSIAVAHYDAGGAVQGFNRAVAQTLDEIVIWLEQTAFH